MVGRDLRNAGKKGFQPTGGRKNLPGRTAFPRHQGCKGLFDQIGASRPRIKASQGGGGSAAHFGDQEPAVVAEGGRKVSDELFHQTPSRLLCTGKEQIPKSNPPPGSTGSKQRPGDKAGILGSDGPNLYLHANGSPFECVAIITI